MLGREVGALIDAVERDHHSVPGSAVDERDYQAEARRETEMSETVIVKAGEVEVVVEAL